MPHDYAVKEIVSRSTPMQSMSDLGPLLDKIKDKKVVMLGESSHGTKEFYEWRSLISRELIEHHGFNFIAVEGDWPPCQEINRYIQHKNLLSPFETLSSFSRWPTWMWGNTQMLDTMEWMRDLNGPDRKQIGFHGLDVYSLYESLDEVIRQLTDVDPAMAARIKDSYGCFEPYRHDEMAYVKSLFKRPEGCEKEVAEALEEILKEKLHGNESFFDATQNAKIINNAEKYYRSMVFTHDSWNVRDRHMMDTVDMLLGHYGPESKGIVWAHNTHIGDYHATDMVAHKQVNIGGLARERLGREKVALVGFTTDHGSVIASSAWDGPIQILDVPVGRRGSLEALLKRAIPEVGHNDFFVTFDDVEEHSTLFDYKGHRAIGVVYNPHLEGMGNYVPSAVAGRYDALVFIEETTALTPLEIGFNRHKLPETYPYGARM
ncbi:MAG TPA: erythromycin esterase family protein [Bacteriovoracaceae bacterium]|nr:erythromycin esterase family protein [Bacteriovoracaceae bacterium]